MQLIGFLYLDKKPFVTVKYLKKKVKALHYIWFITETLKQHFKVFLLYDGQSNFRDIQPAVGLYFCNFKNFILKIDEWISH